MPVYSIPAPRANTQSTDAWADAAKAFMTQPGYAQQYLDAAMQPKTHGPDGSFGDTYNRGGPVAAAPQSDRDLIAGILTAEGGNPTDMGYIADVIANRVASDAYGGSYRDVIMQPGQFSALNAVTGYAGGQGANDLWQNPTEDAYAIADALINGTFQGGQTQGALNYYNPQLASPAWGGDNFRQLPGTAHVFGTAR